MKGHVGLFMLGLGAAAAGAVVYDKYRKGELGDVGERIEELGDRMQEVSHEAVRAASEIKDRIVEMAPVAIGSMVDLNGASREELEQLGIQDSDIMDRLIEGRPYRNKMDLLARMIVPQDVYALIKDHIDIARPGEAVKVA